MNKQSLFDTVAEHLLTQKIKCENENGCRYMDNEGHRCAIGILLSEEDCMRFDSPSKELIKLIEANGIHDPECSISIEDILLARPEALGGAEEYPQLLEDLQSLHDNRSPMHWDIGLVELAEEHGLSNEVVM